MAEDNPERSSEMKRPAMTKTLAWASRIPDDMLYAYPGKRRWKHLFFGDPTFHEPEYMAIDIRSKYSFEAVGTAKSMVVSVPGQGSQYIGAYRDSDGNWVQTVPNKGFAVILRLYGPLEAWLDKTWKPGDLTIVE
jgi:hypothetical protein